MLDNKMKIWIDLKKKKMSYICAICTYVPNNVHMCLINTLLCVCVLCLIIEISIRNRLNRCFSNSFDYKNTT